MNPYESLRLLAKDLQERDPETASKIASLANDAERDCNHAIFAATAIDVERYSIEIRTLLNSLTKKHPAAASGSEEIRKLYILADSMELDRAMLPSNSNPSFDSDVAEYRKMALWMVDKAYMAGLARGNSSQFETYILSMSDDELSKYGVKRIEDNA